MKTEGTMRIPARSSAPVVPVMVAAGIALIAIGAGYVVRGLSTEEAPIRNGSAVEWTAPTVEDWRFVTNADAAQVLRHRPGLERADFVPTHAFGWDGMTVGELFANPVLVRQLRLQPELSLIELIGAEARGS